MIISLSERSTDNLAVKGNEKLLLNKNIVYFSNNFSKVLLILYVKYYIFTIR